MKFVIVMTALVAGVPQKYEIPTSPAYVHDQQVCKRVAHKIAHKYEATQAQFKVTGYRCVRLK